MGWYYMNGEGPEGPVDEARMRALVETGEVGPGTPIWRKGMEEWRSAQVVAPQWFGAPLPDAALAVPVEKGEDDSGPPPIPDGVDWTEEEEPVPVEALDMPDFSGAVGAAPSAGSAAGLDTPDFSEAAQGPAPADSMGGIMPEFVCCACGNMAPTSTRVQFEGKDICRACKARFDRLAAEGGNVFYGDAARQAGRHTAWQVFLGVLAGVSMAGCIGQLVAWHTGNGSWGFPMRLVGSSAFVALGVACGGFKLRFGQLMLGALACCWFGDIFLGWPGRDLFVAGLLAFLVGHLFLISAFYVRGFSMGWAISFVGILFLAGCGIVLWLYPHVPEEARVYVFAYVVAISVMVVFAASARGEGGTVLILLGAIAFYLSDVCVALQRFVISSIWVSVVGLPLYYAAVLMLAYSIRAERPDEVRILK